MKLRDIRKSRGITQEQLAKELNVNRTTITHIETGRMNPTFENADKIARFFDIPLENIFPIYKRTSPYPNYTPETSKRLDKQT